MVAQLLRDHFLAENVAGESGPTVVDRATKCAGSFFASTPLALANCRSLHGLT